MATKHEKINASASELTTVSFPNALRKDGLAETLIDRSGNLYLVPIRPQDHDFDFSNHLHKLGLSVGRVIRVGDKLAIQYPEDADLITLPAVMNAALQQPAGWEDVTHVLKLAGQLTNRIRRQLSVLPNITTIDSLAINRTQDKVELLAPYSIDQTLQPVDIFEKLQYNAYVQARSAEELALVRECFSQAREAFAGGPE